MIETIAIINELDEALPVESEVDMGRTQWCILIQSLNTKVHRFLEHRNYDLHSTY